MTQWTGAGCIEPTAQVSGVGGGSKPPPYEYELKSQPGNESSEPNGVMFTIRTANAVAAATGRKIQIKMI